MATALTKAPPEGPYTSPWTTGNWYLVQTPQGLYVTQDGKQPTSGVGPHANRRDALAWLSENGYKLKSTMATATRRIVQGAADSGNGHPRVNGSLNFAQFMLAVSKARTSTNVAERSHYNDLLLQQGGSKWVEKAAMGEASGQVGGYLVPQQLSLLLFHSLAEKGFIYPRALKVQMLVPDVSCPYVDSTTTAQAGKSPFFGGMAFTWGGTTPETEPLFSSVNLHAWNLAGYATVINDFLTDAGPEAEGLLVELFARGAAWQAEYAFLQGLGAAKLSPLGMLYSPAAINVSRAVASQISAADVANLAASLMPECWKNGVWAANPSTLAQIGKLSTYFVNQSPDESGCCGFLMSRPLFITEKLPALGTRGDLIFCDPSMYVIGERQEVIVDASSQAAGFRNNQSDFRVWLRIDGRTWLSNSVTLADGVTKASSVVVLQ